MKVILLQDVGRLGKAGDVKEVRNGYGFNFLLPQGLAELATPHAIRQAEKLIKERRQEQALLAQDFKAQAEALKGKQVVIRVRSDKGKLFGSVGQAEIVAALGETGIRISEQNIGLEKPFKALGVFPVEAHFGQDIKTSFEVKIEAA